MKRRPPAGNAGNDEAGQLRHPGLATFQPTGNRILVRRLKAVNLPVTLKSLNVFVPEPTEGMILTEGEIIAVGPGDYDDDGDFVPTTVRPGQRIIFNARWNDFTAGELVGSDCDSKGPLERPMPQWQWMAPPGVSTKPTADMHLITEGDIAGILQ